MPWRGNEARQPYNPPMRPSLDADRWRVVSDLLDHALELDPSDRERWLADLSGADAALGALDPAVDAQRTLAEARDIAARNPELAPHHRRALQHAIDVVAAR